MLPAAMERVGRKLAGAADGNRQMVDILTAVLTDGLPAARAEAIGQGVHSADVVLNILARTWPSQTTADVDGRKYQDRKGVAVVNTPTITSISD